MSGPVQIVVMGVAGTGKSTIGRQVADRLGLAFAEGDDFHPQANRDKMASGTPLTDEDRWPWLRSLRDAMTSSAAQGLSTVVACSALREVYRDVLRQSQGEVFFVHLVLPAAVNTDRLSVRSGHYMGAGMLGSQLLALEPLSEREHGVEVANLGGRAEVVNEVVRLLGLRFAQLS